MLCVVTTSDWSIKKTELLSVLVLVFFVELLSRQICLRWPTCFSNPTPTDTRTRTAKLLWETSTPRSRSMYARFVAKIFVVHIVLLGTTAITSDWPVQSRPQRYNRIQIMWSSRTPRNCPQKKREGDQCKMTFNLSPQRILQVVMDSTRAWAQCNSTGFMFVKPVARISQIHKPLEDTVPNIHDQPWPDLQALARVCFLHLQCKLHPRSTQLQISKL